MSIFVFQPKILLFLDKSATKFENCLLKVKFGNESHSSVQNAMIMFIFPLLIATFREIGFKLPNLLQIFTQVV